MLDLCEDGGVDVVGVGDEAEDDLGAAGKGVEFPHQVVDDVCKDVRVNGCCHCGGVGLMVNLRLLGEVLEIGGRVWEARIVLEAQVFERTP